MQRLIALFLILGFASPSFCLRLNAAGTTRDSFHVMDFGALGDGKSDDSQAFSKAWKDVCGAMIPAGTATLVIPKGKTFLLKTTEFAGPCKAKNIHVQLQGSLIAPTMDAWGNDKSNWIGFSYVNGLIIDGGGQINGQGSLWWKKCTSNCQRPTALHFHACNDLSVSDLRHIDSQRNHISIYDCKGVRISNLQIQAPHDSPNTDGIDIALSTNVIIQNTMIGTGDDCIAIINGSSYINITGVACGPGHGISIGSLGGSKDGFETVEEVYVRDCSFNGTDNGVRIKTFEGGKGYAKKITFEQITLSGARNPVIIDQHYFSNENSDPKGSAVKVSDVTYRGVHGSCADEKAIDLNCSDLGCFNLVFDQIRISSVTGKKAYASCNNAYGMATSAIPNISCLLK